MSQRLLDLKTWSSLPRSNGSTGSTIGVCSDRSETFRPQSSKRCTMELERVRLRSQTQLNESPENPGRFKAQRRIMSGSNMSQAIRLLEALR